MRRKFESAFNKNGVEAKSPKIRSIVDFIVNTLKKPPESAIREVFVAECAREESNFHGQYRPPGPQPGASTNSATCA